MAFCKLFNDSETFDQIVCIKDTGDDHQPIIKFFFEPKGLGVCNSTLSYQDTDEGWDARDKVFEEINLEMAVATLKLQLPVELLEVIAAACVDD